MATLYKCKTRPKMQYLTSNEYRYTQNDPNMDTPFERLPCPDHEYTYFEPFVGAVRGKEEVKS